MNKRKLMDLKHYSEERKFIYSAIGAVILLLIFCFAFEGYFELPFGTLRLNLNTEGTDGRLATIGNGFPLAFLYVTYSNIGIFSIEFNFISLFINFLVFFSIIYFILLLKGFKFKKDNIKKVKSKFLSRFIILFIVFAFILPQPFASASTASEVVDSGITGTGSVRIMYTTQNEAQSFTIQKIYTLTAIKVMMGPDDGWKSTDGGQVKIALWNNLPSGSLASGSLVTWTRNFADLNYNEWTTLTLTNPRSVSLGDVYYITYEITKNHQSGAGLRLRCSYSTALSGDRYPYGDEYYRSQTNPTWTKNSIPPGVPDPILPGGPSNYKYMDHSIQILGYPKEDNDPPTNPSKPQGPTKGYPFTSYTYTFKSTDPNGNKIQYKLYYGYCEKQNKKLETGWSSLYSSGSTCPMSVSWNYPGIYLLKAMAKDQHGEESQYGDTLLVYINYPPPPPSDPSPVTVSLIPNKTQINKGDSVQLSWTTKNAKSISISGGVDTAGKTVSADSVIVTPTITTTYVATAIGENEDANANDEVKITVLIPDKEKTKVFITADETDTYPGQEVEIKWETLNANYVRITGIDVNDRLSGVEKVYPTSTTTYTATAGNDNDTDIDFVTVTVSGTAPQIPPPTITLNLSSDTIASGKIAIITWKATNAESVHINNNVETHGSVSGSVPISPVSTTTYVATVIGINGETINSPVTLTVLTSAVEKDEGFELFGVDLGTLMFIIVAGIILLIIGLYLWKGKKGDPYSPNKIRDIFSNIFDRFKNLLKRGKKKKSYDADHLTYYDMPFNYDEFYRRKKTKNTVRRRKR